MAWCLGLTERVRMRAHPGSFDMTTEEIDSRKQLLGFVGWRRYPIPSGHPS